MTDAAGARHNRAVPRRPTNAPTGRPVSVRSLVLQFAIAGAIALFVTAGVTAFVSRRTGTREAVNDARRIAWVSGQTLVASALTDEVVDMEPEALRDLDAVVRKHILAGNLVRVKLWRADGTIVYSDEGRLVGDRYELGDEEREALEAGVVDAEISDVHKPENRFETTEGQLLEVYLPVDTPNGTRLLFEAYFLNNGVNDAGRRVWLEFAPWSLGALVLLQAVQVPLAWSLARRLHRGQIAREQLLAHAIDSSDNERRRIAADLHDGAVQDVSGIAYALAASARSGELPEPHRQVVDEAAHRLLDTVRAMRSLLVEIYPPNLESEGLVSAIGDLLARLAPRGIAATFDHDLPPEVRPNAETAGLVYRVTQEALRNVVSHADATQVQVRLHHAGERLLLDIDDDGVGFDPADAGTVVDGGHVGLRVMADLVRELGGSLSIASAPGAGTDVHLEVPV